MLAAGVPGEDARFVFPNATRTNLVMTTNLRALIHMSGLRLCTMAQWEIRRLFQLIRHEIFSVSPFLGSFLAPKCVPLGYCDEFNNRDGHCPIRPHKDRVLEAWAEKARPRGPPVGSCRSRGPRSALRSTVHVMQLGCIKRGWHAGDAVELHRREGPPASSRRRAGRAMNRRRTRASRGPASRPASRTSSWVSGWPL